MKTINLSETRRLLRLREEIELLSLRIASIEVQGVKAQEDIESKHLVVREMPVLDTVPRKSIPL